MALMTHAELQAATVELLGLTGWSHLHVRHSVGRGAKWTTTTNVAGWPDLFLWSPRQPGRYLAVEVKKPPDWLRDDQAEVLASLASAGMEAYVLTQEPHDGPLPPGVRNVGLFDELPGLLRRR